MRKRTISLLLICSLFMAPRAHADMGKGTVDSGLYVSFDASFVTEQGSPIRAFGTEEPRPPFNIKDEYLGLDQGWSSGASIGYVTPRAILGIFDRAEIAIDYAELTNQMSERNAYSFLSAVDARDFAFYADDAASEIEAIILSGALPLKFDSMVGSDNGLTLGVEPFVRWSKQKLNTLLKSSGATPNDPVNTYTDLADVTSLYYGAMLTAEPELQLTEMVSLAGRVAGGIYGYSSRGTFSSRFQFPGDSEASNALVLDEAAEVGWKASLGAAIKFRLAPSSVLTSYITADYWSSTASIERPTSDFYALESQTAHIGTADLWDLRAGMRLSVGIDK
jgi:hypothetical protein